MTEDQIVENHEKLKSDRGVWEEHWQEVAEFVLPEKNTVTKSQVEGEKKGQRLYDSTAPQACELLAGALHGMMTNPSVEFFDLSTGDPKLDQDDEVRAWLQDCTTKIHSTLNNSNFQTEIHEVYVDLSGFGTSAIDILDDDDKDVRFAARMIAEIVVEENNKGIIDTYYRDFKWNARNIVEEFGIDKCPDFIQKAYDQNSQDKFDVIHAVYPRDLEKVSFELKGTPKGFPFASKYVLKEKKVLLEESGFREFPTAVPRWMKISGEKYGRSPAMKALPDIKMLNEMKKAVIRSAQKTIDPPMQCPDDGFIMPLKMTPGAMNYYRAGTGDKIEPIVTNAQVSIGEQLIQDTRHAIEAAFYIDQLQLNQGPQMTATEVQQRTEEKMRLLGPMLGRQQSELLAPLIERVFAIMMRKKRFPPPPAKLKGKSYHVRYCSLIARAQKSSQAQAMTRVFETLSPVIQIDPQVVDNFDTDQIVRWTSGLFGLPQNLLRNKNGMKAIRQGRQQAQQQQMQAQQQMQQAEMAQKALPALAQGKDSGVI